MICGVHLPLEFWLFNLFHGGMKVAIDLVLASESSLVLGHQLSCFALLMFRSCIYMMSMDFFRNYMKDSDHGV